MARKLVYFYGWFSLGIWKLILLVWFLALSATSFKTYNLAATTGNLDVFPATAHLNILRLLESSPPTSNSIWLAHLITQFKKRQSSFLLFSTSSSYLLKLAGEVLLLIMSPKPHICARTHKLFQNFNPKNYFP